MRERNDSQTSKGTLKLVSLFLALLLEFYFYSLDNSVAQRVSAVIEFQNVPENRIIVEPAYAEQGIPAHIEVYGPKGIVQQIASGFHIVKIPFPDNSLFTFPVDIPYETLRFPPSVTITNVTPARMTVKTVELVRKEVPVEVVFEGSPKEGHIVSDKKIFPKTVILKGPLQELQQIKKISTEPVILTDLSQSGRFELRVSAPGEFSTLNVNLIGVDVEIVKGELEPSKDLVNTEGNTVETTKLEKKK